VKDTINTVIVTYNNGELLRRCVGSVYKSLEKTSLKFTVTVVDNNSSDGTWKIIKRDYPSVNYILNPENFGLSKALNIGIKARIDSHYTLLLNDDVELFDNTVGILLDTLNRFQDAKGIPAALVHTDGRPQWMKLRMIGTQKTHGTEVRYTRFAGTTACLYCTEVFRKVGLFDEFYFFYNEDLDLSLRMKRSGVKFVFNPDARVIHHQSQGRTKAEMAIKPYFYATDYYFYRKNYGPIFASIYLIMAYIHIAFWRRGFKRAHDSEKLALLEKGNQKLADTIRDYRKIAAAGDVMNKAEGK
jgi:GT2 family glycosyltransferase